MKSKCDHIHTMFAVADPEFPIQQPQVGRGYGGGGGRR